jgi:spermidine/putrescine transport system substrate-binding protein
MLNRFLRLWLTVWTILVTGWLAACGSSTPAVTSMAPPLAEELIFYNWPGDVPEFVLEAFTAEYDIRIIYKTFDSFEEAVDHIQAGERFDVVNLDSRFIPALIAESRLAEIDHRNIPNFKNISPNFRELVYDPGNQYTVPYNWGTTGLVVRDDLIFAPVTRWADLWDSRYAGKVAIWGGEQREVLGLTLKSLGYDANSENPAELEAALDRLLDLKPALHFLDSGPESLSRLLDQGEVIISMGYAGDVLEARQLTPHIAYVLPKEGALMWSENFVIPANSPNKASAELFLDFILRPEIAAQIANENFYATPNEAAQLLIAPEIFNDPVIFPSNKELVNAELILPLSRAGQELYDEIWERFMGTR